MNSRPKLKIALLLSAVLLSLTAFADTWDPALDIVMEEDILIVSTNDTTNCITEVTVTRASTTYVADNDCEHVNIYPNHTWPDGYYLVRVDREHSWPYYKVVYKGEWGWSW